jgi:hypothetical protein
MLMATAAGTSRFLAEGRLKGHIQVRIAATLRGRLLPEL